MSEQISIILRSADKTRKASVQVPGICTIEKLLKQVQQRWNLPGSTNYAMRLERTGEQLESTATLSSVGVENDDILEVYPILEAGQI